MADAFNQRNKFYGKMWDGFCLNMGKLFFVEILV